MPGLPEGRNRDMLLVGADDKSPPVFVRDLYESPGLLAGAFIFGPQQKARPRERTGPQHLRASNLRPLYFPEQKARPTRGLRIRSLQPREQPRDEVGKDAALVL
jgi:hypothetical protein